MKTKFYALLASAFLITPALAGGPHGGGGGGHFAAPGPAPARGGGVPSFHSMPMQRFGRGPMIYSGQRLSSPASHAPGSGGFRPQSSSGQPSIDGRRFISRNVNPQATIARFSNPRNTARDLRSTNNLPRNWRNHVVAQQSADWHRDWDRHSDHWWHGHRCHFFNGSWFVFDLGFYPSWPYWYYPYDYYAYSYPYPYDYQPYYYDSGYQSEGYYDQSGYAAPPTNSIVAAAQQELGRQGYYHGEIDGVLGPETRRALLRYQRGHGLRVTGDVTADTLRSLDLRQFASY